MNKTLFGWVALAAIVVGLWNAPAVARVIADYAKDSDRVDGFHAVRATAPEENRDGKLVATNRNGKLPRYIVPKVETADNAEAIDHYDSARLVKSCNQGALAGYASVPADVGANWTEVEGYTLTRAIGGPPPLEGHPDDSCTSSVPRARRVATGVYEVETFDTVCSSSEAGDAAIVSLRDDRPLSAVYESDCVIEGMTIRGTVFTVRVFDQSGAATDAAFTLGLLDSPTVFLP